MTVRTRYDAAIVGGGVIGLFVAHDLAQAGLSVCLFERNTLGREASWAGVGIVPPTGLSPRPTPLDQLRHVSFERYVELSDQWKREFGEDIGFRRTGGLELARTTDDRTEQERSRAVRRACGIPFQVLATEDLARAYPEIRAEEADEIPGLCQVRNPWLMRVLDRRCRSLGVTIFEHAPVRQLVVGGNRVVGVDSAESIQADHWIVSAGAWSAPLLEPLGLRQRIVPIQGQVLGFATDGSACRQILLEGKRYLVPREDGLVLVGSTEEEVGCRKQVTADAIAELSSFAIDLVPALAVWPIRHAWAGLRPATARTQPIIGRPAGWDNLWIASGHFRHGVKLAPGTARLLTDAILGRQSFAPIDCFAPDAADSGDHGAFRS